MTQRNIATSQLGDNTNKEKMWEEPGQIRGAVAGVGGQGAFLGLLKEESCYWVAANSQFYPLQQCPCVTTHSLKLLQFIREREHLYTLAFASLYEASQIQTILPNLVDHLCQLSIKFLVPGYCHANQHDLLAFHVHKLFANNLAILNTQREVYLHSQREGGNNQYDFHLPNEDIGH